MVITDCDLPGQAAEDVLRSAGLSVTRASCVTEADVVEAARGATALVVQWAPVSSAVLDQLGSLRFVSRLGIGYDMIDVEAAAARGIAVANTPTYCVEEVASHTVAMLLALTRGLAGYDRAVRAGEWAPTQARPMAVRPSTTTVAVIGYGRIGELTAQHCRALGFRVLVHDPYVDAAVIRQAGCQPVDLDVALSSADALTLHAPLTPRTRHLVNAGTLATMRPGAVIVNTCRGSLVDDAALVDALRSGRLSGAALDVYESEPLAPDHPLCELDNVILTPHAAWYSPEALADLPLHAARNVVDFLAGRPVESIVNGDRAPAG